MNTGKEKSAVGTAIPATEIEKMSTDIINQAVKKINTFGLVFTDRYAKVIASPTAKALQDFCRQNEEFARAVLDGGTLEECINSVAGKIKGKQAVSDFETYQFAVEYYFPGAKIECRMVIRMSEYELEESATKTAEPAPKKNIELSLDSLLDW